jgi:hypothetical protein
VPRLDVTRRALAEAVERLERMGTPLADAYAARARELDLEAELATAVGTKRIAALARRRFAGSRAADALAETWASEPAEAPGGAVVASDSADPASLLSRMREAIGRERLPFRIVVQRGLSPLAATGEETIWIAAGREVTHEAAERTVLHEVEAHARPRARAARGVVPLFRVGTAGGSDDQEGYALVLEERHAFLAGARRRELAVRHRAVRDMDAGASFADVARTLHRELGLAPAQAVLVAERAFRGGTGVTAGLGRERVYLAAYLRVGALLRARPGDEHVLAAGQVAVGAVPLLAPFAAR